MPTDPPHPADPRVDTSGPKSDLPDGAGAPGPEAAGADIRALVVEQLPDAVLLLNADHRVSYASAACSAVLGLAAEHLRGANLLELIQLEDAPRARSALREASAAAGNSISYLLRMRRPGGEAALLEVRGRSVPDAEGRVVLVLALRDITESEATNRRARFLAEIGGVLINASLDYRSALATLARLLVPRLADYCLIDEATPEGGSRRVAVAHVDPEAEQLLLKEESNSPGADPIQHPVIRVMQTGESVRVADVSEQGLDEIAHDEEHRRRLGRMGLRSYLIVPLSARGHTLGAITLGSSISGRRFSADDLELAEAVAARAALALDNARLYSSLQQAVRAREEVRALVSHDLRNPLATILLNVSAMIETIPDGRLLPEERSQLEWIAQACEQMNRMIHDRLDPSPADTVGLSAMLETQLPRKDS
jgi:PAS domain S-box-containing protein